jgi:hypothetical protein
MFPQLDRPNLTLQEAAPLILEIAESIAAKAEQWQNEWQRNNTPCISLDELVESQEGIDLSKWVQKPAPIDRAPNVNPFPEITRQQALEIAEEVAIERLEVDENIRDWEKAIVMAIKNSSDAGVSLEFLTKSTHLSLVQIWLAVLLSQKLEIKRSDTDPDFWGWEGIMAYLNHSAG